MGAVFWASRRDNAPEGNARYWADALKHRLSPEFAKVEEKALGDYIALSFTDRGEAPYRYLVAVRAEGKTLELAEAFSEVAGLRLVYDATTRVAALD
jgi:hypothetical protein